MRLCGKVTCWAWDALGGVLLRGCRVLGSSMDLWIVSRIRIVRLHLQSFLILERFWFQARVISSVQFAFEPFLTASYENCREREL